MALVAVDAVAKQSRRPRRESLRYRLHQSAIDIFALFALVQIGSVTYSLLRPDRFPYTSSANIEVSLEAIPLVGVAALGVGALMIAGEFDLSIGANFVFSSIAMAKLVEHGLDPFAAAAAGLGVGAVIGAINGLLTLALRIPSFIATLGTAGIWTAATLYVTGGAGIVFEPTSKAFASVTHGNVGVFPAEFAWFIGSGIALWALLQRHRIGNHMFAVGGNRQAAVGSGIRVFRTKMLAFVVAGVLAALAGILAGSRLGFIQSDSGVDLPLQAIAACVVGGLILTGGRGTVLGIMLGAVLIYWIQDVLLLLGAPGFYLSAFVGALIIGAAGIYEALRTRRS